MLRFARGPPADPTGLRTVTHWERRKQDRPHVDEKARIFYFPSVPHRIHPVNRNGLGGPSPERELGFAQTTWRPQPNEPLCFMGRPVAGYIGARSESASGPGHEVLISVDKGSRFWLAGTKTLAVSTKGARMGCKS